MCIQCLGHFSPRAPAPPPAPPPPRPPRTGELTGPCCFPVCLGPYSPRDRAVDRWGFHLQGGGDLPPVLDFKVRGSKGAAHVSIHPHPHRAGAPQTLGLGLPGANNSYNPRSGRYSPARRLAWGRSLPGEGAPHAPSWSWSPSF
jgi:hypothetical protein